MVVVIDLVSYNFCLELIFGRNAYFFALSDDRKITGTWSDAAIVGEFLSRVWLMIMLVPQCEKWCSSCRSTQVP
jgi:hypothetical protein